MDRVVIDVERIPDRRPYRQVAWQLDLVQHQVDHDASVSAGIR